MFTHAILRTPGPDFADGITTAGLGRPAYDLMLAQHAAYRQALEALGLATEVLPPLPGFPDAYFVEDVAVVVPEVAVITRPGALARRGEAPHIEAALTRHRELVRITEPGTLDGGDILIVDRTVFIGLSDRTNAEGARQLAEILGAHGYTARTVPVAEGLHFKSSVTHVGGHDLLVSTAFAGRPEFQGFTCHVVEEDETYACNTLLVNGTLITPKGFPRTRALLEGLGLPIVDLDMSEGRKMDGGLTCMSLRF
ncbi:MAG TPA: arginine deiminase family protein [Holophagaceae bacterium]|nr:arginine deiminase family protein [Holophagaceae bacterium]